MTQVNCRVLWLRYLLGIAIAASIGGCGVVNGVKGLADPPPKQSEIVKPNMLNDYPNNIVDFQKQVKVFYPKNKLVEEVPPNSLPVVQYFAALQIAKPTLKATCESPNPERAEECFIQANVKNRLAYLNSGIALANHYCDRWMGKLLDQERTFSFQRSNAGLFKQLGTTLLGIGGASSAIVSTYGAINTLDEGLAEAVQSYYFFAPGTNRIRKLVQDAQGEKAGYLRKKFSQNVEKGPEFSEIFSELERYSEICTQAEIRRLVSESTAVVSVSVNSSTGTLEVKPGNAQTKPEDLLKALKVVTASAAVDSAQNAFDAAKLKLASATSAEQAANAKFDEINKNNSEENGSQSKDLTTQKEKAETEQRDKSAAKTAAQTEVNRLEKELNDRRAELDLARKAVN